jgi:quercetin dioxygenase-like cupin family protein
MPFYNWTEMDRSVISPQYSTAEGPTIKGGQIEVGRYRFAPGTGSKPHQHPEEQVINVLSGKFRIRIGNVEHEARAMDSEVEIISCKNIVADSRL